MTRNGFHSLLHSQSNLNWPIWWAFLLFLLLLGTLSLISPLAQKQPSTRYLCTEILCSATLKYLLQTARPVLRATWYRTVFTSDPNPTHGKKHQYQPVSEEISNVVELAIKNNDRDKVVTLDGKDWKFDPDSKHLKSTTSTSYLVLTRGRSEVDDTDVVGSWLQLWSYGWLMPG